MKIARRLLPVPFLSGNIYDIAQAEAYLSHMASKGYFVKKIGFITSFEKLTPEKTKYLLEPAKKEHEAPEEEIISVYEARGWKYICTAYWFHVYQATREDAIEIQTDPISQGETFASLNKRAKYETTLYLICIGTILYTMLRIHPIYFRVRSIYYISQIPTILILLYAICQSFWDYRKIKKLKQQLDAGVEMTHYDHYKPSFRQYFSLAVPIIILAYMFFASQYNKKAYWEESLYTYNGKLPTISIAALETDPSFSIEYGENFEGEKISYISHHWTELSPQAYHIEEKGRLEGKKKEDYSGIYSPSMETEYYEMRFQFFAKILLGEMLRDKVDSNFHDKVQYHELNGTKFDETIIVSADGTQLLFARKGTKVIYIDYYGNEKLEAMVDKIYDAVDDFNEA